MEKTRRINVVLTLLAFACLPVLADEGQPAGTDPATRVEEATTSQVEVLTGLLTEVPEKARAAIAKALAASRKGHDAALAALARAQEQAEEEAEAEARSEGADLKGLEKARARVAAAFAKSVEVLTGLLGELPQQAVEHVAMALEKVQGDRQVALDNLDRLIAGLRPERPVTERPARPERPERPDRPERPQIPERPELPDLPEVPALPDIPERPEPPVTGN
jgi:hypothetical protein